MLDTVLVLHFISDELYKMKSMQKIPNEYIGTIKKAVPRFLVVGHVNVSNSICDQLCGFC